MGKDTWLKLHTSILTSRKFISLPHNDHRQAFFILLLLAKKGLESAPESYLLGHLNLSKRRWKIVKSDLVKCGLLDGMGTVNGFIESQLTPDAHRKREQRQRENVTDKTPDKSRDIPQDSRMQKADSRKDKESCSDSGESKPDEKQPMKTTDIRAGEMCRVLAQGMVDNDPKARLPKTEQQKARWIGDMEKINRLDGRDWLVIRSVVVWCQSDDFWRGNILSPGKLRKQFPALVLAMKRSPARSKAEKREKQNRQAADNVIRRLENEGSN